MDTCFDALRLPPVVYIMRLSAQIPMTFFKLMASVSILLLAVSTGSADAAPANPVYLYQENTGKSVKNFKWHHLSTGQEEIITLTEEDAVFANHCDRAGRTHAWNFQQGQQTAIRVVRDGNLLKISGLLRGEEIQKDEKIDDRPWYQPLSFSLRSFLDSPETRISFWMIRSDNLQVVVMQAKKEGIEEITVAGKTVRAQKVILSREGLFAAFWQSVFWFREEDRIFVRYQGVHGPPGTSETTVQLLTSIRKG